MEKIEAVAKIETQILRILELENRINEACYDDPPRDLAEQLSDIRGELGFLSDFIQQSR